MSGPPKKRTPFSEEEPSLLVEYLAAYTPNRVGRSGLRIYEKLVENAEGKWPWSRTHTAASWLKQYSVNGPEYDRRIRKYQKKHGLCATAPPATPSRNPFTREEDRHMVKYIAENNPGYAGRFGNVLWKNLVDNPDKWPWARTHTWQSWRDHYVKRNKEEFDRKISEYRKKHGLSTHHDKKRKRGEEGDTSDLERTSVPARTQIKKERIGDEAQDEQGTRVIDEGQPRSSRTGDDDDHKAKRRHKEAQEEEEEENDVDIHVASEVDEVQQVPDSRRSPELGSKRPTNMDGGENWKEGVRSQAQDPISYIPGSQDYAGAIDAEEDEQEEDKEEEAADEEAAEGEEEGEAQEDVTAEEAKGTEADGDDKAEQALTTRESRPMDTDGAPDPSTTPSHLNDGESRMDIDGAPDPSTTPSHLDDGESVGTRTPRIALPSLPTSSDEPSKTEVTLTATYNDAISDLGDKFITDSYPTTSTPSGQAPSQDMQSPSQVIPSPATLLKIQAAPVDLSSQVDSDIIQGPTPPISASASPPPPERRPNVETRTNVVERPDESKSTQSKPNLKHARSDNPELMTRRRRQLTLPSTNVYVFVEKPPPAKKRKITADPSDIYASIQSDKSARAERRSESPTPRREPPRLIEGAYNSAFTDAKGRSRVRNSGSWSRVSGVEEGEESSSEWPPRRNKGKGTAKDVRPNVKTVRSMPAKATARVPDHLRDQPVEHHPFSQPSQTQQPFASSSQVLPVVSEHHPFSQQTQVPLGQPKPAGPSHVSDKDIARIVQVLHKSKKTERPADSLNLYPRDRQESENPHTDQRRHHSSGVTSETAAKQDALFKVPSLPTKAVIAANDPFNDDDIFSNVNGRNVNDNETSAPSPISMRDRRQTFGGFNNESTPIIPHLNKSYSAKPRVRQSMPGPSQVDSGPSNQPNRPPWSRANSMASTQRLESPPPSHTANGTLEADEAQMAMNYGVELMIHRMSENHGFNEDVVRNLWRQAGSLKETDVLLRKAREAAEAKILEELDAQEAQRREREKMRASAASRHQHRASRNFEQNSSVLQYTLLDADDDVMSDYTPPPHTRAAQLLKRMNQQSILPVEWTTSTTRQDRVFEEHHSEAGIHPVHREQELTESDPAYRMGGNDPSREAHDQWGKADEDYFLRAARNNRLQEVRDSMGSEFVRTMTSKFFSRVLG